MRGKISDCALSLGCQVLRLRTAQRRAGMDHGAGADIPTISGRWSFGLASWRMTLNDFDNLIIFDQEKNNGIDVMGVSVM